jgi:hypothetical protein
MYNFYSTDWHICYYKDMSKLEVQMNLDEEPKRKGRNVSKHLRTVSMMDSEGGSTKPSTAEGSENFDPQMGAKKPKMLMLNSRFSKMKTSVPKTTRHNHGGSTLLPPELGKLKDYIEQGKD